MRIFPSSSVDNDPASNLSDGHGPGRHAPGENGSIAQAEDLDNRVGVEELP